MEAYRNTALAPAERAKDLLARLTLREKVGQVNQRLYGFAAYERTGDEFALTAECIAEIERYGGLGFLYGLYRADPWSAKTSETGVPAHLAPKVYNLVQRTVMGASRFGIPVLMTAEASHGLVALGGYMLPANIATAAAFNPQLTRQAFGVYGKQCASLRVDYALMSVLDVLRDPRWGRSEECFGEDPYLAERLAEAAVAGCAEAGVEVCAKHLCAQGETTGGINSSPARIGQRELREIHLPPVWGALRAGATGIMAAYNEIDGVPCHANPALLRGFLRDECGFTGIVMADGTAIDRLDLITGDNMLSGALALESGVDVNLWDTAFSHLDEAVEKGELDEALLDEAVLRVLEVKFRRGLFENPFMNEAKVPESFTVQQYPASLELARQSVVLLENKDGFLPLDVKKKQKIAVIGPNSDDIYNQLGDYAPPLAGDEGVTLWQAMQAAESAALLRQCKGSDVLRGTAEQLAEAVAMAEDSDVVVLALGGSSNRFGEAVFDETGAAVIAGGALQMDCGEGMDRANLELPGCQQALFEAVCATGKPVVAIVLAGRPMVVGPLAEKADALLYSFYPGPWGGTALAELLFGKCEPAGRLPVSLPRHSGQIPCWYNGKLADKYRVYCDMDTAAQYTFGYGKGYAPIALGEVQAGEDGAGGLTVRCTVRNTGKRGAWAVPMVYLRWLRGHTTARRQELKGFAKLYLKAGASETVEIHIPAADLHRVGINMDLLAGEGPVRLWLCEGGSEHWSGEVELHPAQ